jgi:hypothetical protein
MRNNKRTISDVLALPAILLVSTGLACNDPAGVTVNGLAEFEAAWSAVNSVYPFFEFKQIDWDAVHAAYRSRAEEATGGEVYVVLLEMLGELKDPHVQLRPPAGMRIPLQEGWFEADGTIWPYIGPRLRRDRNVWTDDLLQNYVDRDSIHVTRGSPIGYAITNDRIGYLRVAELMPHDITPDFDAAMNYLRFTKGMIVDVRHNPGGNHDTTREFVGRFLAGPLESLEVYILGELYPWPPVQPRGPFQYTKPVVVLINGRSFSGAEAFAEMMKQLSHVTAVGDTTGGGSGAADDSAPGVFRLPSGSEIKVPTGEVRRYDGLPWEWLGVPPDIRVEQTELDRENGVDRQLEHAIEFLNRALQESEPKTKE